MEGSSLLRCTETEMNERFDQGLFLGDQICFVLETKTSV